MAHESKKNRGYPSLEEAVHFLTDGNIRNIPKILPVEIERAYKIYCPLPEYVRGQMVKMTVSRMPVGHTLRIYREESQAVHRCHAHRQGNVSGIHSEPIKSHATVQGRKREQARTRPRTSRTTGYIKVKKLQPHNHVRTCKVHSKL